MHGYDFSNFKNGKAFIHFDGMKDGKWDYGSRICINTKGEKLFELPDRDMVCFDFEEEDVAFVSNYDGLEAMINNKGEFLTDFVYKAIYGGSEEGLFECRRNSKHGHVDINGKEIIPCMYDEGNYFSEGLASECLNGKWGMIDYFNNTIIPFEYESLNCCRNNIIPAKKNGRWGLINKNNEVLVDFIYDELNEWGTRECLVISAMKDKKCGFIDRYGNVVEDFIYDETEVVSDYNDNLFEFYSVTKDNKKALYSTREKAFLTAFEYDYIDFYSEGKFVAWKNNKEGAVNTYGEVVVPFVWDTSVIEDYNEGVLIVRKNKKYGAVDEHGDIVIPCKYKRLQRCSEGLILAYDSDYNNGYIDKTGNIVIPFGKYNGWQDFHCGLAAAWNKEQGNVYINKQGEILELKV